MVATLGLLDAGEAVPERHLGAGDGLNPRPPGRVGELHGAVEAVVVGQSQGRIAELHGPQDELLGMGRAVQERESRMAVELDVGDLHGSSDRG